MPGYIWTTTNPCGGVDNTRPDFAISDDCLADCSNYSPDYTGGGWMIKRQGISPVSTAITGNITSVFGGRNGRYFTSGTSIYRYSGTALHSPISSSYKGISWCSFLGYDIIVDGTYAYKTSDGTTFTAVSGIPSGTSLVAGVNNFLYAATSASGSLRWSDYGTAETWDATNEIILGQDSGDKIWGLCELENGLGVWCENSFYIVSGYSDIDQEIAYYSFRDGCRSPRSIVNTPYGIFWWSKAGIVWCKEGYQLDYPMLRKLAKTLNGLYRTYDIYVHAVWDKVQQRVMFWLFNGSTQTTVNLRVDYFPAYDAFYLNSGLGVQMRSSASINPENYLAGQKLYVGGYGSAGTPTYLYAMSGNYPTDNGTTISSYLETKREGSAGALRNGKTVIVSTDQTAPETITYGAYIDASASANVEYHNHAPAGANDWTIALNLANRRIKHRISDSATTRTRITQLTHTGMSDRIA